MLRFIISTLLIYGLIRLIFNFIIPVFRTAKQMKSQVKDFQERMNGHNQYQHAANQQTESAQPQKKERVSSEDYIDFEEIKSR